MRLPVSVRGTGRVRIQPRARVACQPVVEHESVPAVDIQPAAGIEGEHTVAHRKAPDVFEPHTVAAEMAHLAVLNPEAVLLARAVVFAVGHQNAVYAFADPAAVERQPLHRAADRVGQVEQAGVSGVAQQQHAAAVAAERPRVKPLDGDLTRHFQPAAYILARRHQHAALDRRGRVHRRLNRPRAVRSAVADGSEFGDIKYVFHFDLFLLYARRLLRANGF